MVVIEEVGGWGLLERTRLGRMESVKVALCNRGMTVDAA